MEDNMNFQGNPVTTNVPMLYDETVYKVYIVLKDYKCNNTEIKATSKVCGINYIQAKNKLTSKKTLIAEGRAYKIRDTALILSQYDVKFEVEPSYPYEWDM